MWREMEPEWEDAHKQLIDRGFFKSESRDENVYIAGQRCRWSPTERFFEVVKHLFADWEQLYPEWIPDEHTRPPMFRDDTELLEHRNGMLTAKELFSSLERVVNVHTYPRVNLPQRPDLHLWGHGEQRARVEVLTNHRNSETWKRKFDTWRTQ